MGLSQILDGSLGQIGNLSYVTKNLGRTPILTFPNLAVDTVPIISPIIIHKNFLSPKSGSAGFKFEEGSSEPKLSCCSKGVYFASKFGFIEAEFSPQIAWRDRSVVKRA